MHHLFSEKKKNPVCSMHHFFIVTIYNSNIDAPFIIKAKKKKKEEDFLPCKTYYYKFKLKFGSILLVNNPSGLRHHLGLGPRGLYLDFGSNKDSSYSL